MVPAIMPIWNERVAQPVEHVTFNHGVVGSSPTALTSKAHKISIIDGSGPISADNLWQFLKKLRGRLN